VHRQNLPDLVFALSQWFQARDDVYVTGNLFFSYFHGDPSQVVCPDVCVVFGSPQRHSNTYRTWRDGPFPHVVIELASAITRAQDLGPKRALYERLGVLDYYVFDPTPRIWRATRHVELAFSSQDARVPKVLRVMAPVA
jgi:Uma2 family endonuclease